MEEIVDYFDSGGVLQLAAGASAKACLAGFSTVPGLLEAVATFGFAPEEEPAYAAAACELVLEALVGERRISRSEGGRYGRARRGVGPVV